MKFKLVPIVVYLYLLHLFNKWIAFYSGSEEHD